MRGPLGRWAIALTITIGVPTVLIYATMPYIDVSHAEYLVAKGDYRTALHALNRALAFDPNSGGNYARRSFVYDKLGEYQQAFADADRAVALCGDMWEGYNNRAWALCQMHGGDMERAWQDANRAVALCPGCARAFDTRGLVELKENQPDKALADFNRAIELDPALQDSREHRLLARQLLDESNKNRQRPKERTL